MYGMLTIYQIPCSCDCGEIVERSLFKNGACQVRGHRDKLKKKTQIYEVGEGRPVEKIEKKAEVPIQTIDWQIPNLSKAYFTRKKK